jgi:hypothetical protein
MGAGGGAAGMNAGLSKITSPVKAEAIQPPNDHEVVTSLKVV